MRPNMTVVTRVNHTAMSRFFFMKALSDKSQIRQQHIDQLDSDKWSNDSPDAIEQQVAAKKRGRSDRPIPHASESQDRKSTRLNSSHGSISYAVFCLKTKTTKNRRNKRSTRGYYQ